MLRTVAGRTTPAHFTPESTSTLSESSSTLFQPDAVHCWLFARSTFPREFRVYPGSQCAHVTVTSQPEATFVSGWLIELRLYAAMLNEIEFWRPRL